MAGRPLELPGPVPPGPAQGSQRQSGRLGHGLRRQGADRLQLQTLATLLSRLRDRLRRSGPTSGPSVSGGRRPLVFDPGPHHQLEIRQDRDQLPDPGDRLPRHGLAGAVDGSRQGRQFRYRGAHRAPATLCEALRADPNQGAPRSLSDLDI